MKWTNECGIKRPNLADLETSFWIDGNLVDLRSLRLQRRTNYASGSHLEEENLRNFILDWRESRRSSSSSSTIGSDRQKTPRERRAYRSFTAPTTISLRPWRKTPRNSDRNLGDLTSRKKLKGQSKSLDGQRTKTPLSALKKLLTFVTIITNV